MNKKMVTNKKEIKEEEQQLTEEQIENLSDIEIIKIFGIGRTDFYWIYDTPDKHPRCVTEKLTNELIEKHIRGEIILGCSPFINDTHVSFGDIDIDAHFVKTREYTEEEKQSIIKGAEEDYKKIWNYLKENNYPVYANKSGGSAGTHIRIYVKNQLAREVKAFLEKLQIELLGKKVYEVFPKQIDLRETEKHIGNQSKLFCGIHPKTGNRTELFIDGIELTLEESIKYLKNILLNFNNYKKIEISEQEIETLEKKRGGSFAYINSIIPEYCAFIEEVASKTPLISGEGVNRHQWLDHPVSSYTYNRPDKLQVRKNYQKIQSHGDSALDNWPDKTIFSCGKIINYLKASRKGDINAEEGLRKCLECEHFKNYHRKIIFELISKIPLTGIEKETQTKNILELLEREESELFLDECLEKITERTRYKIGNLKVVLKKIKKQKIEKIISIEEQEIGEDISFYYDKLTAANLFQSKHPFFYDTTKNWWLWSKEDFRWLRRDDVDVLNIIKKNTSANIIKTQERSEIINSLKQTGRENNPKTPKDNLVQYKNKIVEVFSGKENEATPEYFFTNPVPWSLGKNEDTPVMDKLFRDWVPEEKVPMLYEILAYSILPSMPFNLAICLYGKGRNGKDQYVKIVKKFLDGKNFEKEEDDSKKNCVAMSLNELSDRFTTSRLYKKLMVEIGEIDNEIFEHTAIWKRITGGTGVSGQFKGKDSFSFISYAKPFIHTNRVPETDDTTDGYYRRWLIIRFEKRFEGEKDIKDVWKTIPNIEFENLARKSVRLVREVLQRGKFTGEGTDEEKREEYIAISTPLGQFIDEECEIGENFTCEKVNFIEAYQNWSKQTGFRGFGKRKTLVIGEKQITTALKGNGYEVKQTKVKEGNDWKQVRIIKGLKLKFQSNMINQEELL